MAADRPAEMPRRLRADAQRNRDAILSAARAIFDAEGVLAPLDAIALRAGVGNATLYRNFPTRDDLLAAVMTTSVDIAQAEAAALMRDLPPRDALAEWLAQLAWRLRIWHDLPHCVADARAGDTPPLNTPVARLVEQTEALLERARRSGDAVASVDAGAVFELVTALSWAIDRFGDDEAAARSRVGWATAGLFT